MSGYCLSVGVVGIGIGIVLRRIGLLAPVVVVEVVVVVGGGRSEGI